MRAGANQSLNLTGAAFRFRAACSRCSGPGKLALSFGPEVETTGLSLDAEITTAVLYDGRTIRYYVNGRNLDDFLRDLALYQIVVTYNGASFDVPVIQRFFNVRLNQGHIDLRFPLRSLNLAGGLKTCERVL